MICNRKSSGYSIAELTPESSQQVPRAPEGSAEAVLAEAGLEIAVLDLRLLPKGIVSRYFNAPLKTWNGLTRILPMAYDAPLFIESTTNTRPVRAGSLGSASTLETPSNLDFEEMEDGRPKDWKIKTSQSRAEYQTTSSHDQPYKGNTCAMIERVPGRLFGEAYS